MQELILHIEYLLGRHDCVTLPGFGAFVATRCNAHIEKDEIKASTIEVCFNPAIAHDDGLLANSFSRRLGLSYEEARIRVAEEIESLRTTISEGGEVTIGRIGTLRIKEEGKLAFTRLRSAEAAASNLGFPTLCLAEPVAIETSVSAVVAVMPNDENGRRFRTDKNYYIPINKIFARTAACVALVVAVGLSIFIGASHSQNERQYASVMPVAAVEKKIAEESAALSRAILPAEEPSAVADEAKITPEANVYYLIVATFNSEADARTFIENKKDNTLRIVTSGRMSRVSAGSSADKATLIEKMGSVAFKACYGDCWIWKK